MTTDANERTHAPLSDERLEAIAACIHFQNAYDDPDGAQRALIDLLAEVDRLRAALAAEGEQ